MRHPLLAALLIFFAAPTAIAQPGVVLPMDSVWAPWAASATHKIGATLLKRDAATGTVSAIAGQRVEIGGLGFLSTEIRARFPGQKTTPMLVAGVRLFHAASGTGWDMPEHQVNVLFPAAVEVPAGHKFGCTYTMPKTGQGALKCEVDSAAVTGVILPPPPPPAPAGPVVTADGTRMPPAAELRDSSGAVWTVLPAVADGIAGQVGLARNGVRQKGSINYATVQGGVVFNFDPPAPAGSGSGCERWNGTAWTLIGAACPF
jgi:hypothetical protein